MIFFLVSFLSFLLLITNPLPLKLPSWVSEMRLLSVLLCQEFLAHSIQWFKNYSLVGAQILKISSKMFANREPEKVVVEEEEEAETKMTMLDLPELTLDLILGKLTPVGLFDMSNVCTSLRPMCRSGHLWGAHFREKWGRVIGRAARKEFESFAVSMKHCKRNGGVLDPRSDSSNWLYCFWPCSWFVSKQDCWTEENFQLYDGGGDDSVMKLYMALESGRFWFPAQVYNREYGHAGFMLSCYDAEVSYDSQTDTFYARYPPHGKMAANVEERIQWDRIRASPVNTTAHDLHVSDCLNDLRPGDHIEIQWRRNKEFPYGWWYGVVGHLESCDGDEHHCLCDNSDTLKLEFNQYSPDSRWKGTLIDRKDHREKGNEADGFYGGIRKIYDNYQISTWRRMWPTEVLE